MALGAPWALALAANLKVFPALAAIWWVGRRDWRSLGWFAAWLVGLGVVQLVLEPADTLAFPGFLGLDQVGDVEQRLAVRDLAVAVGGRSSSPGSSSRGGSRRRRWGWAAAVALSVLATPRLLALPALDARRRGSASRTTDDPSDRRPADATTAARDRRSTRWLARDRRLGRASPGSAIRCSTRRPRRPRRSTSSCCSRPAATSRPATRRTTRRCSPARRPVAERLFYSYPPAVAQAMALVRLGPVAGHVRRLDGGRGRRARGSWPRALGRRASARGPQPDARRPPDRRPRAALLPVRDRAAVRQPRRVLPARSTALVLLGVAARGRRPERRRAPAPPPASRPSSKLHPASLGLWLLARSRDRRRMSGAPSLVAAAVASALSSRSSLLVGGIAAVDRLRGRRPGRQRRRSRRPAQRRARPPRSRSCSAAHRAAESLARPLQIPVTLAGPRGHRRGGAPGSRSGREPRLGRRRVARRPAGDLVPLPVGADPVRDRRPPPVAGDPDGTRSACAGWSSARAVVAAVAIAFLPLIYVAIGLVLAAVRVSGRAQPQAQIPALGAAA